MSFEAHVSILKQRNLGLQLACFQLVYTRLSSVKSMKKKIRHLWVNSLFGIDWIEGSGGREQLNQPLPVLNAGAEAGFKIRCWGSKVFWSSKYQ